MLDVTLRPIPKKDVDYKNLKLQPTPEEYFLLSRVNGSVNIAEICAMSTMSKEQTLVALERLEEAGLIEIPRKTAPSFGAESLDGAPIAPPPTTQASSPQASQPAMPAASQPAAATSASSASDASSDAAVADYAFFPVGMAQHSYDQAALAEDVELDEAQRKEILYVYDFLKHVDYYALLSIGRDADRKDVRGAFFTMSKRFHPDLYFGKELGSYKTRIEAIFQQINKAQQVLSHKQKRAEYDEQLAPAAPQPAKQAPQKPAPQQAQAQPQPQQAAAAAPLDPAELKKREMAFGVLLRRGEKLETAGDVLAAAQEYKNAFAIKHEANVALRAAGLLMRSGAEHIDEAIGLAKAALKADPKDVRALILIGDAYEEQGRFAQALEYYDQILKVEPSNKAAQQRRRYVEAQRS